MYLPQLDIEELLFSSQINFEDLRAKFNLLDYGDMHGDFQEIHWLNTPGPIYTTFTDNCGTGQIAAINNVGGDENYHEVIFKQPFSFEQLNDVATAAFCDPFESYYFDGSLHWNIENIAAWWDLSEKRLNYVIDRYQEELELPEKPHVLTWKIGEKVFSGQLYGPCKPIPENYKAWLDFYQSGMKEYLEWYILKLCSKRFDLAPLNFEWARKNDLDLIYQNK